jgi:hypothetical protein
MNPTDDQDRVYERVKARVEAIKGFYIHAIVYVIVNAGLFTINMLTNPDVLWFYWPLIGWGVGLAINGVAVFAGGPFSPDWEERKIREALEDERRRAQRPA